MNKITLKNKKTGKKITLFRKAKPKLNIRRIAVGKSRNKNA